MSYDLTFMSNSTSLLDTIQGVNAASGTWYGTLLLFIIWIGLYIGIKKEDSTTEFIISSFIVSVIGIMFFLTGLVTFAIVLIPMIVFFLSLIHSFIAG